MQLDDDNTVVPYLYRVTHVFSPGLCTRKLPDVSGPGLGEAGRYNMQGFLVGGVYFGHK